MKKLFVVAVVMALLVPVLGAQEKKAPNPDEAFAKMDKDGDKKLSLEEFKGKREGDKATKAEAQFKAKDKDKDGFLSLEEFKTGGKKKK